VVNLRDLTLESLPAQFINPFDIDILIEEGLLALAHCPSPEACHEANQGENSAEDPSKQLNNGIYGSEQAIETWAKRDNQQATDDSDRDADPRGNVSENKLQNLEEIVDGRVVAATSHGRDATPWSGRKQAETKGALLGDEGTPGRRKMRLQIFYGGS
jgi:hypothetical protein